MTKKLLTTVLTVVAATTLMTSTVFAAKSVTDTQEITNSKEAVKSDSTVTVGGKEVKISDAIESGEIELKFVPASADTLAASGVTDETAVTEIVNLNNATAEEKDSVLSSILEKVTTTDSSSSDTVKTETLSLLTDVQDLTFTSSTGEVIKDAKNVTVTWKAPLVSGMNTSNIRVLHYSTVSGQWELIKPDAVDPETGKITAFFADLSPVAIVYVDEEKAAALDKEESTASSTEETATITGDSSSSSNSDSSVQTGDSSNVVLYVTLLAIAAVAGAGVCVAKKRSSKTM